ncbi:DUF2268 domain-containing protein [Virgibacillus soli]|uniref:DUF2268 domain-containing protein n=1 Tax=Paracerasibacillus soli TaxID=480284 RepID=UPI0035EEA108
MTIINTEKWLIETWDDPIEMCEQLEKYFQHVSSSEIYHYLTMHGMYHHPLQDGESIIQELRTNNCWEVIRKEEQRLRKLWNGPDIPIFIFPADPNSQELRKNFNGKSGLAFADKLFLFLAAQNSVSEMKALFTHEYNHVCRLAKLDKKETDYVLLDSIIIEGLAEYAVLEQFGDEHTAQWTTYHTDVELENMWQRLIYPMRHLPKGIRRHHDILYGARLYPKMVGYCVGYYLVHQYAKKYKLTSKELFEIPSYKIAQITDEKTSYFSGMNDSG